MPSIHIVKEQEVTDAPLLLFDCELTSGAIERWSTHKVQMDSDVYQARVLRHNLFEVRSGADEGVDAVSRVSLSLANADSHFSQIERNTGWKGARLTVRFVFFNLKDGAPASDAQVLFRGVANPPDEITESTFRLTFANRLSLQRVLLPEVRIQKRCPWTFPATQEQRADAVTGGLKGKYSPFFRCGYSPDIDLGVGNLNGGAPFTTCDYTKAHCQERGMYGTPTQRFGGVQYVPSTTQVRSYGETGAHAAPVAENQGTVQRLRPADLRHGLVSAPGSFRTQRRQPDPHGSAARHG
jgi:hypothetical protein